jgi:predicted PurR-regulated permease PerM
MDDTHPHPHAHPATPAAAPRVPAEAVAARHDGRGGMRPAHLYRAVTLAFALALAYRWLDPIAQVFLLSYAAVILAVALNALQKRIPLERKWVAVLIGLAGIGAVVLLAAFGVPALVRQMRGLSEMLPELQKQFASWEAWLKQTTGMNLKLPSFGQGDALGLAGKDVLGRAGNLVAALFVPIVVFFGALFALASPNDHLLTPMMRLVPADRRPAFYRMLQLLGDRILGWLKGTFVAMLGVGVLSVLVFWAIGVPYALLLGIINGLLEFIPLFGPWTGGILATLVAFMDDPSKAIWVAMAALGIQQVEANLITPWAMRSKAEIHPFVTLFALVLFGGIFGFMGLLLALPLTLLAWTAVQVFWVERTIDTDRDRIAPVVKE